MRRQLFAMYAPNAQTLFTCEGRVIVHNNEAELRYMCPGVRIVELTGDQLNWPTIRVADVPLIRKGVK